MTFATIIKETGIDLKEFENCSQIPVVLYDRKNRIVSDENLHYAEKLFANSSHSFKRFNSFLKNLEKDPVKSMDLMISENFVVLFYKSSNAKLFPRTTPICPIDFEW